MDHKQQFAEALQKVSALIKKEVKPQDKPKGKKMQINNFIIQYSKIYEKWQVKKGKIVYEEFSTLESAKNFASSVKQFTNKK